MQLLQCHDVGPAFAFPTLRRLCIVAHVHQTIAEVCFVALIKKNISQKKYMRKNMGNTWEYLNAKECHMPKTASPEMSKLNEFQF